MKVVIEKESRNWGPVQEWTTALKSKENNALECMEIECKALYSFIGADGDKYQLHDVEDLRPMVCSVGGYGCHVWFTVTRWIHCRVSNYTKWAASRDMVLEVKYYGAPRGGAEWTWYDWKECDETGVPCGAALRITPYTEIIL